ncbi:AraC family transcriptional regulator [Gracilibacillus saliphilus]|uniref:AraC family transcriptional regulator n=1 Tax=Gracilibacillus saliphilus TaxID=543890 RepID=UPI0013D3EDB8|nr:helix-turn-helix domain-containing protein [Gracilibacillus saliphilus]
MRNRNIINISHREHSFYFHYENKGSSKGMISYHLHNDYEIYFLLEGKRRFLIDSTEYCIEENSIVFINKNVRHMTCTTKDSRHKRFVLNFNDGYIQKEASHLIESLFINGPTIIKVPDDKSHQFLDLLYRLEKEYTEEHLNFPLYIQTLLIQFLIASKRLYNERKTINSKSSPRTNSENKIVASIIKFINENFHRTFSLTTISQKFYLSEGYICQLFNRLTGYTIIQYTHLVRIIESKKLLHETDLKISVIASKVGFSSHVHYCRVFKKNVGKTPTQYRTDTKEVDSLITLQ